MQKVVENVKFAEVACAGSPLLVSWIVCSTGLADAAMGGQSFHCYRKFWPPFFPLLVLVGTSITSFPVQKGQAVNVLVSDNSFILPENHYLYASDYYLLMKNDCDLVLYEDTKAILSSNTSRRAEGCNLRLQAGGNLAIYNTTRSVSNSTPLWEFRTFSNIGTYYSLVLNCNGSLIIFDFVNAAPVASLSASMTTGSTLELDNLNNSSTLAWAPSSAVDGLPYMPVGYYLDEGCSLKSLSGTFNLTLAYDCNLQSLERLQNGSSRTLWETKTMSFGPGHQCRLSLQSDGNLRISTIGSDTFVWASNVTGDVAVNWALVVDHVKGDVIVRDLLDPANILWNSANYPESTDADRAGRKVSLSTGLLVGVGAAVFLLTMVAVFLVYYFSANAGIDEAERELQRRLGSNKRKCQTLTLATIKQATGNFETKIGHGGFGDVFYGKLASGQEIAVKVLSAKSQQTKQEFYNEVELLTTVHHKYLVSLVGYCLARKHRYMLVYEHMGGGDLRRRLQGNVAARNPLNWTERTTIILQIAEAIEYLHYKCSPAIIHRDIKSNNILLTKNLVAKVADFGLSKVRAVDQEFASHVTTLVKGTPGYLDPEYHESGLLTEKSDVYAFGIVVMEILTGQHQYGLTEKVLEAWSLKQLKDLADPHLIGDYDRDEFQKLIQLSLSCACRKSAERPSMTVVVHQLQEICHKIVSESFNIEDEEAFSGHLDWQR